MTATILSPEQLLASEPVRRDGLATPFNKEGNRTVRFTWSTGTGPLWRNAGEFRADSEHVPFFAVLTVTHHKKGRRAAHYRIELRQHHGEGASMCIFDGRNGHVIETDASSAGRFNQARLHAYADSAVEKLRAKANDVTIGGEILAYFKPERV